MRLLFTFAALTFAAGSSLAQPAAKPRVLVAPVLEAPARGAKLDCVANQVRHADQFGATKPRRLDELPRGNLYLSVMREVEGCQEMVLVSEERGRLGGRR
ncbi:MAG TPA: hypothetical protein VF628_05485 [Allosphingosinicella sp.]|jgi:hypothetical protein